VLTSYNPLDLKVYYSYSTGPWYGKKLAYSYENSWSYSYNTYQYKTLVYTSSHVNPFGIESTEYSYSFWASYYEYSYNTVLASDIPAIAETPQTAGANSFLTAIILGLSVTATAFSMLRCKKNKGIGAYEPFAERPKIKA
jgi:hypothetical protein